MILVDYSQVMIAAAMMSADKNNSLLEENYIRHFFLNSVRFYRSKFYKEYGEIVLACDNTNNWRKKIFPYYKIGRKKSIEKDVFDWKELYRILGNIREEVKEFFPYKVLYVMGAEGDDIIGTIVNEHGTVLDTGEKILIISTDKDFGQLHKYGNVKQYDPVFKKRLINNNVEPNLFLKEHIIRGDSGDSVPNILSKDNCIAIGEKQKMMTKGKFEKFMNQEISEYPEEFKRNFQRNQQLIDLSFTPKEIKQEILDEYNKDVTIGRSNLMSYFMEKNLKNLSSYIQDF